MKQRAKEMGLPSTRINSAGCLDRCEFGPVMVIYPEGVWYSPKNEAAVFFGSFQYLLVTFGPRRQTSPS